MEAVVYNGKGEKVKNLELPEEMFGLPFLRALVHQVVRAQFANARIARAHTKGRGEVRGGGVKPWRQKGTGRARHGSIRSPLWVGGGVTFGPTKERNFSQKVNKKMKRRALFSVLSRKFRDGEIFFLEEWKIERAKTKLLRDFLRRICGMLIPGQTEGAPLPALLLVHEGNDSLIRASRNIPSVSAIRGDSLNAGDLLRYRIAIFSLGGFVKTKETFLSIPDRSPQKSFAVTASAK